VGNPKQPRKPRDRRMSRKQTRHLISDTVTGANLRVKDNLYQGLAILVCLVLGALIGCLALQPRLGGAIVGGVLGAIVGLIGSGVFLMVYRAVKHARGEHD
jgi:hypothetical protein